MLGRDLPRQASATTPPDPRQEARVIRGVQRATVTAHFPRMRWTRPFIGGAI